MTFEKGFPRFPTGPFAFRPHPKPPPDRIDVRTVNGVLLGSLPLERYHGEPRLRYHVLTPAKWWDEVSADDEVRYLDFEVGQWGVRPPYTPCIRALPVQEPLLPIVPGWKAAE